ncbi:glutamyl-tRNA reductase [Phytohabitans sp. LJ34]|uniref:glutamyl-tRNA reductase n=1 Tax=Phytohabitans sp. LJ34 TaxID=3452217 RepID=UPI003F8882F9
MNLIVVGASYRTAPVSILEQIAVAPAGLATVLDRLLAQAYVSEAVVLSTCNRVEVYAAVNGFHGGLTEICSVLGEQAGRTANELAEHLYVHYDAAAVRHAFRVASGLDSMVVGEAQILGQLREAYQAAIDHDSAGRLLHELMQQALRVGKRAHTETGIDRAGQSVVTAALGVAASALADDHECLLGIDCEHPAADLAGRPALVIGAGAMGSLSLATLARSGAGPLTVTNRRAERAERLATAYGATAVPFADLPAAMSAVDVVATATASTEHVLTREAVARAVEGRDQPLVILDLAVPRDVEPAAAEVPGVVVIDIDRLAASLRTGPAAADEAAVEAIVAAEVDAFLGWMRGADVAPTVAALRTRADDVVTAELRRLSQRRPDLSDEQRADVAHTVHRVVQRLLHSPTVRVRQLAAEPGGDQYTALLRELFDLEVPRSAQAGEVPDLEEL